jgi:hypothetical protein
MAIQFVKVIYPTTRTVNVDHLELGDTGELLKMDAGHRIFDLGAPLDYMPGSQTVRVGGTTRDKPLLVVFTPIVAIAETTPDTIPAPPLKMAKRVGAEKPPTPAKKDATKTATKLTRTAAKTPAKKTAKKSSKKAGNAPRKTKP